MPTSRNTSGGRNQKHQHWQQRSQGQRQRSRQFHCHRHGLLINFLFVVAIAVACWRCKSNLKLMTRVSTVSIAVGSETTKHTIATVDHGDDTSTNSTGMLLINSDGSKEKNLNSGTFDSFSISNTLLSSNSSIDDKKISEILTIGIRYFAIGRPIQCGYYKCFFYSKTNSSLGYLLPRRTPSVDSASTYKIYSKSHNLAFSLARDYPQIGHFHHMGPPLFASNPVNNDVLVQQYIDSLNATSLQVGKKGKIHIQNLALRLQKQNQESSIAMFVIPVVVAPQPNIILNCNKPRYNTTLIRLQQFVQQHVLAASNLVTNSTFARLTASPPTSSAPNEGRNSAITGTSLRAFYQQLSSHVNIIQNMTNPSSQRARSSLRGRNKNKNQSYVFKAQQEFSPIEHNECLLYDMQVLLDKHGRLYHIDLDRCFNHEGKINTQKSTRGIVSKKFFISCFNNLYKMINETRHIMYK